MGPDGDGFGTSDVVRERGREDLVVDLDTERSSGVVGDGDGRDADEAKSDALELESLRMVW